MSQTNTPMSPQHKSGCLLVLVFLLVAAWPTFPNYDPGIFYNGTSEEVLEEIEKILKDYSNLNVMPQNQRGGGIMSCFNNDINHQVIRLMRQGKTPLAFAIEGGNVDAIQLLIANGADVNFRLPGAYFGGMESTPLLTAIEDCPSPHRKEIIKLLIGAGADVNEYERGEIQHPLMAAISPCYSPIQSSDARIGGIALSRNAICYKLEIMEILINAGADIEFKSTGGRTPLIHAVYIQHYYEHTSKIISILLKAGADIRAKCQKGKNVLDYAKENESIYMTKAYEEINEAFHASSPPPVIKDF